MPPSTASLPRVAVRYARADVQRQTTEPAKDQEEREPFEIDRARILHSAAFRRLQRKTQVFASGENDFFRTRLTHSLEVSQIAKGIALRLGANPTLCEAASLAHDIGHPPFGHAGERVLHDCMREAGGFEGNAQNLRVLSRLEVKSLRYEGLNLTRGTLDSLLKYKSSYAEASRDGRDKFFYDDDLALVDWICGGKRDQTTSFECQIMEWADDVAYSIHDVEDGMQAGLITLERLKAEGTRALIHSHVPDAGEAFADHVLAELRAVLAVSGERQRKAARKTWSSAAIHQMVSTAFAVATGVKDRGPRYAWRLSVDEEQRLKSRILKALALGLVFQDLRVAAVQQRADMIVRRIFDVLMNDTTGKRYPADFRERLAEGGTPPARLACDYISGMTDVYAERAYKEIRE